MKVFWQCFLKGENLRHDHVLITVYISSVSKENILRPDKKISYISGITVLQGRFQCHKKQWAPINVIDLK